MVKKTILNLKYKQCYAVAAVALATSIAAVTTSGTAQDGQFDPTTPSRPTSSRQAGDDGEPQVNKREGTRVDTVGAFKMAGDRATFRPRDGAVQYQSLENLALERVTGVLANSRNKDIEWSVTGTLTEFRGRNYLLIERAVVKARAPTGDRKRAREISAKNNVQRRPASP